LAEDEESFVGGEGDFVMAVEAATVVDPAVSAFESPLACSDDDPVTGFGLATRSTVTLA
jgi:hypothetical protein